MHTRREIIKAMSCAAGVAAAHLLPVCRASQNAARGDVATRTYRDKAMGCFLGAAIGDAMGGPVECQHYKRIAREFPDFENLLPYRKPPGLIALGPGYALGDEPGNITDDTYIRLDLARFLIDNEPPYTASRFADWLLKNADFRSWWSVAVQALKRIEKGEATAENSGLAHRQGGGGGWWQPVAILHAGNPQVASAVAAGLCRIWKAPLEQDILSAVVAGQAAAFQQGATVDSVVDAILADAGPLATKLFTRAIEIARGARTNRELYEQLYAHCLIEQCSTEIDGPMPPRVEPRNYADGFYSGILFAEQQPLALAYSVYGQGDPRRTVLTAVKGGRDADSIATNAASWLGALSGESVWPQEWLDAVQQANLARVDLRQVGEDLVARGLQNGTVRLERIAQNA